MNPLERLVVAVARRIFTNSRVAQAALDDGAGWRFLLVNGINFIFFRLRLRWTLAPSVVVVEPSDVCNLKCPFCFRTQRGNTRDQHYLTPEIFTAFIKRNRRYLTHVQFGMWGEPLTNKWLPELVKIAADAGNTVYLVSNTTLMTDTIIEALGEAGVRQFTLSFDSIDDEYETLRGVPFTEARAKLDMVLAHKRRFGYRVIISAVGVNEKYSNEDYRRVFDIPGVDYINIQPLYSVNGNNTGGFGGPCYRAWHTAAVYSDGDVSFCAFDQDKQLKIGNIRDGSLAEIVNGDQARVIRKGFVEGRFCALCQGCDPYYR